jgi:anaerobic selenocysteine-containing dehydrogenase
MRSMERAEAGGIRSAWALGGNLFGSSPDAAMATRALAAIDQVVYFNTTLNTGHIHGRGRETWVLPVLARDEEPQATSQESMFSYVRLSDGGSPRHAGPRSEVQVISSIAGQVLGGKPIDWAALADHGNVRQAIGAVVPGLEELATIDATKQEFHIPGRRQTGSPQANLRTVRPPQLAALGERQLRTMTIRSEGQFNSVVYEDVDRYRGARTRDVILLAAADIARLGLRDGEQVTVSNAVGSMRLRVCLARIRAGNAALYYPEANVLVPRDVDPESGTPAFKSIVVTISS